MHTVTHVAGFYMRTVRQFCRSLNAHSYTGFRSKIAHNYAGYWSLNTQLRRFQKPIYTQLHKLQESKCTLLTR